MSGDEPNNTWAECLTAGNSGDANPKIGRKGPPSFSVEIRARFLASAKEILVDLIHESTKRMTHKVQSLPTTRILPFHLQLSVRSTFYSGLTYRSPLVHATPYLVEVYNAHCIMNEKAEYSISISCLKQEG